jgi:hypothetical protein
VLCDDDEKGEKKLREAGWLAAVVPELSSWKFSGNSTHSAKLSSVFFPSSFFKEKK